MPKSSTKRPSIEEILQNQLIVQLGLAGVPQQQIRQIVAVDIHRVSRIVKLLAKKAK